MADPEHRPDAQNRPVSDPQAKDDPEVVQRCRRCTGPLSASQRVDTCRSCQKERARAVSLHRTVVALPEADFRRWLRRVLWERAVKEYRYWYGSGRMPVWPMLGRFHLRWHEDKTVDVQALPLPAAGKEGR